MGKNVRVKLLWVWAPFTGHYLPCQVRFSLSASLLTSLSRLFYPISYSWLLTCSSKLFHISYSSVQFKIVSVHSEKLIIMRSTPSLRGFPNVAFETVPMFVWLTLTISRPFKEDLLALPLSTPLFQAIYGVLSLALCSRKQPAWEGKAWVITDRKQPAWEGKEWAVTDRKQPASQGKEWAVTDRKQPAWEGIKQSTVTDGSSKGLNTVSMSADGAQANQGVSGKDTQPDSGVSMTLSDSPARKLGNALSRMASRQNRVRDQASQSRKQQTTRPHSGRWWVSLQRPVRTGFHCQPNCFLSVTVYRLPCQADCFLSVTVHCYLVRQAVYCQL